MTGDAFWSPLMAELDRWAQAGQQLHLWLRDDDAVAPNPALDRLAAIADRFAAPVLLAVIPMQAEPALATTLRSMPLLLPCQHGCRHRNLAPADAKKSEFPPGRTQDDVETEIALAQTRLRDLFPDSLVPIFVPPWNRIDPRHAARLPGLGFIGLSCFRGYRLGPGGGPVLLPTHLDVMDWKAGRVGRTPADLVAELTGQLMQRRSASLASPTGAEPALGILLHHRDHDDAVWAFLEALLRRAEIHPAVTLTDPRRLLAPDRSRPWNADGGRL